MLPLWEFAKALPYAGVRYNFQYAELFQIVAAFRFIITEAFRCYKLLSRILPMLKLKVDKVLQTTKCIRC